MLVVRCNIDLGVYSGHHSNQGGVEALRKRFHCSTEGNFAGVLLNHRLSSSSQGYLSCSRAGKDSSSCRSHA